MKAVGIIVEYNPFHNGHAYHIQKAREVTNADCVIAVMSGNFLQRGEPALVSKFSRAKMALKGGCDLVVELPYAFSSQHAEIFASGAVGILSALKVDTLVFGSESGDIHKFQRTLQFLKTHEYELNATIQKYLKQGMSYPKAYAQAAFDLDPSKDLIDFTQPNNMLGLNYLKAIESLDTNIEPLTIKRVGAGYHEENLSSTEFSSATGIRKLLLNQESDFDLIKKYVPSYTYQELLTFKKEFQTFSHWEHYWTYLKYQILSQTPESLRKIYEMEEGLENRVYTIAKEATSFSDFMKKLKTKRYTWTRLQRLMVHVLTNTKKSEMKLRCQKPEYIRLLGANETGRTYLNKYREQFSLPIISKVAQADPASIQLDLKASYIYSFGFGKDAGQKLIEAEIKQPPIIL